MPPTAFRFLHAIVPSLDRGPRCWSRAVPPEVWEEAPRWAFDRAADHALQARVDFVFFYAQPGGTPFSGQSFGPGIGSLAEWRQQCARLTTAGIPVVIAVDAPEEGWNRLATKAVTVVGPASDPAELRVDGRVLARFRRRRAELGQERNGLGVPAIDIEFASEESAGVDPGANSADYTALLGMRRQTGNSAEHAAHSPGPLQGRTPAALGPHGVSVVTLHPAKDRWPAAAEIEFSPTAPLRIERPILQVAADEALDDLALRMMDRQGEMRPVPGETDWLVDWQLELASPRHPLAVDRAARTALVNLLPGDHEDVAVYHAIRVVVSEVAHADDEGMLGEFVAALSALGPRLATTSGKLSLLGLTAGGRFHERLTRLAAEVDTAAVMRRARTLGQNLSYETGHRPVPATGDSDAV